jgi:hypothetical protein
MIAILLEGSLFVGSIAAIAALVFYITRSSTSLGLRAQQNRNREAIEREADLVCSVHGQHTEEQLVRLESGERICPECFREAMKGIVD